LQIVYHLFDIPSIEFPHYRMGTAFYGKNKRNVFVSHSFEVG